MITTLQNDVLLLNELKQGDQLAFKTLYEKYNASMYLHAYKKLGDKEIVKDLVHEVFLSLWEKRSTLAVHGSLSTYLHHAVRYKVIDIIAAKYTTDKYRHFQSYLDQQTTPSDYLVRERIMTSIIDQEIENLPPRMREVFQLSRAEHLSHHQIAEKLGISTQSVRSHIKNALRILRVKLSIFYPFLIWLFD